MSSIAYVTDSNMIQYHRLNGNRSLNFWRPSINMNFSDFHKGDLLFFLAKGTEKGRGLNREKGIVGYGVYEEGDVMPPSLAWKRYQAMNGYNTKEEFFEAICKITKSEEVPGNISCLHLNDVVFFQSPIYLSEVGVKISNQLESYTYIDKEDETATLKILEKAKDVGIDLWSLSFDNPHNDFVFEYTKRNEIVRKIALFLDDDEMDSRDRKNLHKLAYDYLVKMDSEHMDFINGSDTDLCEMDETTTRIYVPLVRNARTKEKDIQKLVGKLHSYKSLIQLDPNNDSVVELHAIVEANLEEGLQQWIENSDIIVEVMN